MPLAFKPSLVKQQVLAQLIIDFLRA